MTFHVPDPDQSNDEGIDDYDEDDDEEADDESDEGVDEAELEERRRRRRLLRQQMSNSALSKGFCAQIMRVNIKSTMSLNVGFYWMLNNN